FLFFPLVATGGARAFVAKIGEIVVAGVAVGPGDVHTCSGRDMNLNRGRLLTRIEKNGHRKVGSSPTCAFRGSSRRREWESRAGTFSDGRGTCRCADRVPG